MSDIQNKIIKVKEILVKEGGKFILVSDSGDRFNFKQHKADGGTTQQYRQVYEDRGPLQAGSIVKVGFEPAEFKGVHYNKLVSALPYTPKPGEVVDYGSAENAAPGLTNRATERSSSVSQSDTHTSIIRQVAFKGVVELVAKGWLEVGEQDKEKYIHTWTDKLQRILESTLLQQPAQVAQAPKAEALPVIDESVPTGTDLSDIDVESIPF